MFGTTLPASAVPAGGRAFAALVRRVEAAQAEGFVREGDPAEQARIAWCAVHGAAHLAVQEKLGLDGRRLRTFVGRLLDSLLSGLEPRDGAGA